MFEDYGGLILLGLTIGFGVLTGWIVGNAATAKDHADPFHDRDTWGV
jgi:hypothetical protein